jgi:MoaA/NifB/PqqE/SkfB family radical SAM enzyme
MKYTFEITIAGCSVSCAHCYINAGPSIEMTFDNVLFAIAKVSEILSYLPGERFLTLGDELFNHSKMIDIIKFARTNAGEYFSYNNSFILYNVSHSFK